VKLSRKNLAKSDENCRRNRIRRHLPLQNLRTEECRVERRLPGWRPEELESLIDLLHSHNSPATAGYGKRIRDAVGSGCVHVDLLDGFLEAVSPQLGEFAFCLGGRRLVELFGIGAESYYVRPARKGVWVTQLEALSLAGVAALMIRLERAGICTHPENLVQVVNEAAAKRRLLTPHELECLWYLKEKALAGRYELSCDGVADRPFFEEIFSTVESRKFTVLRDCSGLPHCVVINPPDAKPSHGWRSREVRAS
jgi:hypothetical protein